MLTGAESGNYLMLANSYQSYLLRLWQSQSGSIRSVNLQCTATRQQWSFHTLDAAYAFLANPKASVKCTTREISLQEKLRQ